MDGAAILERLRGRLGSAIVETHAQCGDHTAVIERAALPGALSLCRDAAELAFDVLMDLTAVDYQKYPGREDGPRFEVVYHLSSRPRTYALWMRRRATRSRHPVLTGVPP